MPTTKIQICPPPPPPPSPQIKTNSSPPSGVVTEVTAAGNEQAARDLQSFGSQPWQGWFSQVYNQIRTQFVVTTGVADGAATNANTALADAATALTKANTAIADAGVALSKANTAIADAAAAQTAVASKLNKSAADTLTGAVSVTTGGGFVAGTLTWDGAGNRTGGYGVAMTSKGLVGYSSSLGGYSFSIDASGNASFAGALSAASGTFTGSLISASGTFTGALVAASGTFTGTLSSVNGTFTGNLSASAGTFTGTLVSVNGTFTGSLVAASGTFTGTVSAGTINGGTVTGALIRTSSSGQRLEMDTAGLKYYDPSGSVIGTIDSGGVFYSKSAGAITAAVNGQTASSIGAGVAGNSSGTAPGVSATNSSSGPGLEVSSSGNAINIQSGANGIVQNGGGANFVRDMFPIIDNTWSLGLSGSLRWTAVYAMSSTITTSDGRTKNRVEPLPVGLNMVEALRSVSYYQNVSHNIAHDVAVVDTDGVEVPTTTLEPVAGKRPHYGFIAQEVREALTAVGVEDAALWTLANPADPESVQSLRYEEFIAVLWQAVRELSGRVKVLEAAAAAGKAGV